MNHKYKLTVTHEEDWESGESIKDYLSRNNIVKRIIGTNYASTVSGHSYCKTLYFSSEEAMTKYFFSFHDAVVF